MRERRCNARVRRETVVTALRSVCGEVPLNKLPETVAPALLVRAIKIYLIDGEHCAPGNRRKRNTWRITQTLKLSAL